MKKIGFIFPILFILIFSLITPRMFSGQINPMSMLLISGGLVAVMLLFRPKKAPTKTADAVAEEVLDDYCADAFADNAELARKFQAALRDLGGNMPKSAVSRLEKLAPLCTGKKEQYAVAMAAARAWKAQNNYNNAIREYNKALVLNPTGSLAYAIGEAHQRLGNLDKARDSYEFAAELDPGKPQYFSSLATVHVANGNYRAAINTAEDVLALEETNASALATMAISYGMLGDSVLQELYTRQAVNNGYSEEKIRDTVKALKKREK